MGSLAARWCDGRGEGQEERSIPCTTWGVPTQCRCWDGFLITLWLASASLRRGGGGRKKVSVQ